jgi:MoaA/NifB/PqqE/SkfB family radical SAM enzyme
MANARSTVPDVSARALLRDREPEQQVEIQLGHLCNNRCVFCVSGQRTARGQAGVSPVEPILARIREARARGHRKITLLGGEPTLQPGFLTILEACAALGFEEVVVFTNGAKTASGKLIDQALATGAKLSFRISIQGATEASHEGTTLKDGSFGRIVRTLEALASRGQKTTVNMCLVASNHADVHHFAPLLLPHGVRQLHVDLMRPLDAGDRSDEELAQTLAPLSEIGASLTRMVEAFPASFDVNVGNLPFCLAPSIAERIHHDGQPTETIAIDGGDAPSEPWDKYEAKRRDKVKLDRCERCVFDAQCTGIYADYLRFQGDAALVPVTAEALEAIDPSLRWTALHTSGLLRRLSREAQRDGVTLEIEREDLKSVRLRLGADQASVRLISPGQGSMAGYRAFSVEVLRSGPTLGWLAQALLSEGPVVPLAPSGSLHPRLASALGSLSRRAPFGALVWRATEFIDDGLELVLGDANEARVRVRLFVDPSGKVGFRYTLVGAGEPSELKAGLVALVDVLKEPVPPRPVQRI